MGIIHDYLPQKIEPFVKNDKCFWWNSMEIKKYSDVLANYKSIPDSIILDNIDFLLKKKGSSITEELVPFLNPLDLIYDSEVNSDQGDILCYRQIPHIKDFLSEANKNFIGKEIFVKNRVSSSKIMEIWNEFDKKLFYRLIENEDLNQILKFEKVPFFIYLKNKNKFTVDHMTKANNEDKICFKDLTLDTEEMFTKIFMKMCDNKILEADEAVAETKLRLIHLFFNR